MALSQAAETELLTKVREIHAVFIGIEGQPGRFQDLTATVHAQGKRLRVTERFQWVLTGGGIVLGFIAYHFEHLLNAVLEIEKLVPAVPAGQVTTGFLRIPEFWRL